MAERFKLLTELGRGGMGVVWKARDEETGSIVALKLLHPAYAADPDYVKRFERELELARRIDSPNVVKVLGFGVRKKTPYLALEYVDGPSLRQLLASQGPYSWPEARPLLAQITQGLVDAHAAGVIHRDLKPSNVLIGSDGVAKLADFGIARGLDLTRVTGTSTMLGTPAYLPPEGPADERSDLYSLGVIAYEMMVGSPPFEGRTYQDVILRHVREAPDLEKLPSGARPTVGWLLAKNPAERPQQASDLLAVLVGERGLPAQPREPSSMPALTRAAPAPIPAVSAPAAASVAPTPTSAIAAAPAGPPTPPPYARYPYPPGYEHPPAPGVWPGPPPYPGAPFYPGMAPAARRNPAIIPILAGIGLAAVLALAGGIYAVSNSSKSSGSPGAENGGHPGTLAFSPSTLSCDDMLTVTTTLPSSIKDTDPITLKIDGTAGGTHTVIEAGLTKQADGSWSGTSSGALDCSSMTPGLHTEQLVDAAGHVLAEGTFTITGSTASATAEATAKSTAKSTAKTTAKPTAKVTAKPTNTPKVTSPPVGEGTVTIDPDSFSCSGAAITVTLTVTLPAVYSSGDEITAVVDGTVGGTDTVGDIFEQQADGSWLSSTTDTSTTLCKNYDPGQHTIGFQDSAAEMIAEGSFTVLP